MPFPEHVTLGWSLAYAPRPMSRASALGRPATRLPTGRVYPSWCLVYPPLTAPPGARPATESSDPAEHLLRQVFAT
jgi:hypothetical protein